MLAIEGIKKEKGDSGEEEGARYPHI